MYILKDAVRQDFTGSYLRGVPNQPLVLVYPAAAKPIGSVCEYVLPWIGLLLTLM